MENIEQFTVNKWRTHTEFLYYLVSTSSPGYPLFFQDILSMYLVCFCNLFEPRDNGSADQYAQQPWTGLEVNNKKEKLREEGRMQGEKKFRTGKGNRGYLDQWSDLLLFIHQRMMKNDAPLYTFLSLDIKFFIRISNWYYASY